MPVDIDLFNSDRLKVTICDDALESQVSVVLAGLLTSQFVRSQGFWTLSFHDFQQLKSRLDQIGLTKDRTATEEAVQWIEDQQASFNAIERIKRGEVPFDVAGIEELKTNSSKWIKTQGRAYDGFAWQSGYGAFSVGLSQLENLKQYIARQRQHHRRQTFQEEFRAFLARYQVPYDERYVWD